MKSIRFVCLITFSTIATLTLHAAAQMPPLTKGISVQMVQTNNAAAYPAADRADAWVVAVTADGRLYVGAKPVTPEQLFEEMKIKARQRDAKLYVKVDARSKFSALKSALGPARSAEFAQAVLLTSQPGSAAAGSNVSPLGIEVQIVPPKTAIEVQLTKNGQTSSLTVNEKTLAWSELEATLKNLVRRHDQVVEVEANDSVSAGDVIRAIDKARKTGATVALPMFHSL